MYESLIVHTFLRFFNRLIKLSSNLVGRPTIQQFIGALQLKGARKGILITTSDFTREAIEAVSYSTTVSIVLINGYKLVNLMYEHNIGVGVEKVIQIKKIDNDYFE